MFIVDVSPSMANKKIIDLPPGPDGQPRTREVTRLEWILEFVMYKVQEMVHFFSCHYFIFHVKRVILDLSREKNRPMWRNFVWHRRSLVSLDSKPSLNYIQRLKIV